MLKRIRLFMKDLKEDTNKHPQRLEMQSVSSALSILSEIKAQRVSGSVRLADTSLLHFEDYAVNELKELLEQINILKIREDNGHKDTV